MNIFSSVLVWKGHCSALDLNKTPEQLFSFASRTNHWY